MEEEAEKIRQMQNEVEKQMNRSTTSTLSKCFIITSVNEVAAAMQYPVCLSVCLFVC